MMEEEKDKIYTRSVRNQYLATVVVDILAISQGISVGWTSPSLYLLTSDESPLETGQITMEEASWIASLPCVGGLIGNILFGFITNKFGRKLPLNCLAIPYVISWLMILFAQNAYYLFAARVINGMIGGAIFVTMPLYLTEIADDSIRGTLGSTIVFNCNFGIVLAFTLGNYCDYFFTPKCVIVLAVLFFVLFIAFPESPAFLLKQNKYEEAEKSIEFYQGISGKDKEYIIQLEMNKLKSALGKTDETDGKSFNWSDLLSNPGRKALIIGAFLAMINPFCGSAAIQYYSANIFAESGSSLEPNTSAIIVGVIQFFGAFITVSLVDRAGRKFLYGISSIGTGIGLSTMGVYMMLKSNGYNVDAFNWIPIVSVSFVVLSAAWALLNLPYVVVSELMPSNLKDFGASFCMSLIWIFGFVILKSLPLFIDTFSLQGLMFTFAGVCFTSAVLIILYLPETKGKSYEQIMDMLR